MALNTPFQLSNTVAASCDRDDGKLNEAKYREILEDLVVLAAGRQP